MTALLMMVQFMLDIYVKRGVLMEHLLGPPTTIPLKFGME
jgi:hypothetical protein